MKSIVTVVFVAVLLFAGPLAIAEYDSSDLIKGGLIGAGAGAVGGAASGAKGSNLWKGALAGAGVNIVGGALLDSMSGEKVDSVDNVQSMGSQQAYSEGYQAGFGNGYKQGYTEGYKDGLKESLND